MKHKHRATGGVNEAELDLRDKPTDRTNATEIAKEAEERKRGGHVKRHPRKAGGKALHGSKTGEGFGPEDEGTKRRRSGGHVKRHVGEVHGEHAKHHGGRKPRKAGGKVGSDSHPFTSAYHGEAPKGRKLDMEMD